MKSYLSALQDKPSKSGLSVQGSTEDTYIAASYILCLSKPRTTQDPMLEDPVQDSLFHEASETAQGFEEENKQMQETFTWKPAVLGDRAVEGSWVQLPLFHSLSFL